MIEPDKFSVLVVDDDDMLLHMLSEFFRGSGHYCDAVPDGEEALKLLGRRSFDVMVTDIILPGIKGLELTEKAGRLRPEMSTVVMTGYIEQFSYDEAIMAGAVDFIKKPFTLAELMLRIRHARLQEQLRSMSFTDELTGLPNRRGFFSLAEQQLKMAQRNEWGLVLLFADLDGFKRINDTQGHRTGDEALMEMSALFRKSFRDSDIIARMGGDEFAILLVNPRKGSVAAAQKRLHQNLDRFNARPGGAYALHVSIGSSEFGFGELKQIDELLKAADERMYQAKERKKEMPRS